MVKTTRANDTFQTLLDSSGEQERLPQFPSTRYQGSKKKIINWIERNLLDFKFDTVLDCFGGTGVVSYMFKQLGKLVTYNDYLAANSTMAKAIIENKSVTISESEIDDLFVRREDEYANFIERTFEDIYFTVEENQLLDLIIQNAHTLNNVYRKAIAFFSIFQACIIKRPYNLFHRKNLYMRTAKVKRSFGNKTTWEQDFNSLIRRFSRDANFAIFDNGRKNRVLNMEVLDLETNDYDMVYIDPPYVSPKGVGVDYHQFYHFLEGLVHYDKWDSMIDWKSKHRRIKIIPNEWIKSNTVANAFDKIFEKFQDSILVVSYRSPGIPSIDKMKQLLKKYKKNVQVILHEYQYVLSKPRQKPFEVLLIAS